MIPDHPNWSGITSIAGYPQSDLILPEPVQLIQAVSLGGIQLADISQGLLARYWVAYQEPNGEIYVAGATGNQWDSPVGSFTEHEPVLAISLTFDQLARPTVFYQTPTKLKLYWYDPVEAAQVVAEIDEGSYPHIAIDIPEKPGGGDSDIIMVYANKSNQMVMRIQRERWGTAHLTGVEGNGLEIFEIGKDVRNRFQIIYRV